MVFAFSTCTSVFFFRTSCFFKLSPRKKNSHPDQEQIAKAILYFCACDYKTEKRLYKASLIYRSFLEFIHHSQMAYLQLYDLHRCSMLAHMMHLLDLPTCPNLPDHLLQTILFSALDYKLQ